MRRQKALILVSGLAVALGALMTNVLPRVFFIGLSLAITGVVLQMTAAVKVIRTTRRPAPESRPLETG